MPLLIGGTAQGVEGMAIAAPTPASQGSSDMGGRSTVPPQKSTLLASSGSSPTGVRSATVVAAQEEGLNAFDQPLAAQAASEEGASEPSASAGVEPDAEQPTPQPSADPAPGSPVDEEAEEDEQAGGKVTLCHKAGSKKPKTIVVGENAVEEHLTHGDTIGVCP